MSLTRNILANYASQIYVTFIGIFIFPIYLKYMGAEAYGLVGFFTMLQVWFGLLDLGLSPTVARETARYKVGAVDAISYLKLLRVLQIIFFSVALLGGGLLFWLSDFFASSWLKVDSLPIEIVRTSLQLIAIGVALRWMSGLYRGCISGSEQLVWLSAYNSIIATLRFVMVLPLLIWIDPSPVGFFFYQLIIAILELTGLFFKARDTAPLMPSGTSLDWSLSKLFIPVAPILKFSLSIAFTSSVWIVVTQTDKLILSKLISLADYGYFTLSVLVASGVMMISGPISSALMPRMARLQAIGDEEGLIRLYRDATQGVAVIAFPVCLILAMFAQQVLWIWTDDAVTASKSAPILSLYALGNGILAVGAFPYYLQYAKGDLKLHLVGNVFFVVLLIPVLIWAILQYGVIGAGYAWLGANLVYFLAWVPVVHARFLNGLHTQWLLHDVGGVFILTASGAIAINISLNWWEYSPRSVIELAAISFALLAISAVGSSWVRRILFAKFRTYSFSNKHH